MTTQQLARERAEEIANDVSEGIDNGESREELREAIRFWAAECAREATARARFENILISVRSVLELLNIFVPPEPPSLDGKRPLP